MLVSRWCSQSSAGTVARRRTRLHSRSTLIASLILLIGLAIPSAALSTPPTTAIRYVYDADGQLRAVYAPASETALYSWDATGNLLSLGLKPSTKLSINKLTPERGAVGETVVINGTGFSTTVANDTVKFNGKAATVSAATEWALTVKVPTGATSGTVTVQTTTEGPVTSSQTFVVAASPVPKITSLSTSVAATGSSVTITGTSFEAAHTYNDAVTINQTRAYVSSATSTSLKITVPGATLGGKVIVRTPQGVATGPDLYIPPESIATSKVGATARITVGGAGATVKLTTTGKVALGVVDATAGERVSFTATESTISGGGLISLWTPNGTKIAQASFSTQGLIEPLTAPTTGTYTILVTPSGENSGNVKLTSYLVKDVTGAIVPTVEGAKTTVALGTPGQNANYTVEVVENEVVSLQVGESTYGNEVVFEWLNSKGELVNRQFINGGSSKYLGATRFATAGTYTLVVNPNELGTGSMTLTAYNASDITGSLTLGEPKKFTIAAPGQQAKITFSGKSAERISILGSEIPSSGISVQVLNPEGGVIYNGGFGREGLIEPLSLPTTGTYTIVVGISEGHTGSFKLTDYQVTDVTGAITPTVGGAKTTVTLGTPGQNADYTVEVTANEVVSLQVAESTYGNEVVFEWLNSKGELVNRQFINGGSSKYLGATRFATAGTYTLVVNPNEFATGSMTLTAYNASDVTGSLAFGEPKKYTIAAPGQLAKITFSGKEGELVTVKSSESTIGNGSWAVLNPEGSNVSGNISLTGEPKYEFTPTTTGTYTILVTPSEAETGNVTLAVYKGSHPMVLRPGSGTLGAAARTRDTNRAPTNTTTVSLTQRPQAGGLAPTNLPVNPGSATTPVRGLDMARSAIHDAGHRSISPDRRVKRRSRMRRARLAQDTASGSALEGLPGARELRAFRPSHPSQWQPPLHSGGRHGWESLQPPPPWAKMMPLSATGSATGLSGQVLALDGLPVAGVHVAIDGTYVGAQTDGTGRFVLSGQFSAGHRVLVVEGETASGHQRYGTYEIGVNTVAGKTTALDYTIWLTPLDRAGDQRIASPTTHETRLSTPRIPGLEVRLPAGTTITDASGKPVRNLNMTAIPVDRPPFPLPAFVSVPLYFTVQPGRAYISKGAQIIYPNWGHLPAGQRVNFWNYEADNRGWYVYGQGTVTPNGKQVVPDPTVRVWEFTGAMISSSPTPPEKGQVSGGGKEEGDPVDLYTGLLNYHHTDLVLPDTIPIKIERSYRQSDTNSYSFGIGTASIYDMRLWSNNNYHEADLILPDGGKVHYVRISPGEGFTEAIYESTSSPGLYYASTLKWNQSEIGWDLTLTNGTTYVFGEFAGLQAIRDRFGNKLTITRTEGQKGNITQITSPHGRWVTFAYDGSNRITEIKDIGGRTLKYNYNVGGTLEKVTDAAGRITKYEYNTSNEMTAVTDGRGNTYLKNEYDTNQRVSQQTLGDGGIFKFAYTLNGVKQVESTTVTDPRNIEEKVTFNTEGFPTNDTKALGTAIQQTTTYEPQAGTGLPLSVTDPRGRKTTYKYDSAGNIIQAILLAGTGSARTLEYKYEPGTNELSSFTDGLKHITTSHYGEHGELLSETDPLTHKNTFEYDTEGDLIAATNALSKTVKLSYEAGDLVAITDPLSRRTKRFVDALGRTISTTSPGGQVTLYEDNLDNQILKIANPLEAATSFEYDGDGNQVSITDPRIHKSTVTYDPMDRPESETDPLEHSAHAVYDKDGNVIEYTDRRGKLIKYAYDSLNRMKEVKFGVSGEIAESTIKYEYDNGNRLTKIIDSATGTYTPEYDEFNRLKTLITPAGTISYEYDEADRRTSMTVPGQEPLKYKYDEANRLTELKRGTQVITFAYDAANRPTKTTLVDGVEEIYGYDNANELTSIAYKKGATTLGEIDYSYDSNGRREATWGSYARSGLPEAITTTSYNADNEQTERNTKKPTYDADGNLTSDGTSEFKWNARGQLSEISGGTTASFTYDPFGRRISRTIAGITTKVLFDGPNTIQETQGTSTANLINGLKVDTTLARTTTKGTENYLTDALGSTIALAGSTAKAETTYTYDAFGGSAHEGVASENPMQYAGRENDTTGLYYNRARYYSPGAGRFVSQDPLGQPAGGPNLYTYVANSPTNATDPTGTSMQPSTPGTEPGVSPSSAPGASGPGTTGGSGGSAGGTAGSFGPGPGGSCKPGVKGKGLAEGIRCKNYERLEQAEEEIKQEQEAENETLGDKIDNGIQTACDLSGPAILVGLRKVPVASRIVGAFCLGFTAGNLLRN